MPEAPTTFEELLADLSRHEIDYILVGGLAVTLCGYVRATIDVDILIRVDDQNVDRLLQRLEHFGEGHARELSLSDFAAEEGSIRVVEDFPVVIFTVMSGHKYEDLLPMTDTHRIGDVDVVYLNADGLILLKSGSLRPRDQMDVEALKEIKRRGPQS